MIHKKKQWLSQIFQSEYFEIWMALKCFQRYSKAEVQNYICFQLLRTRKEKISFFFPQLLHILLLHPPPSPWESPIFVLLYKLCREYRHLSLDVTMYILSTVKSLEAGDKRYFLCVEMLNVLSRGKSGGSRRARVRKRNLRVTLMSPYKKHLIFTVNLTVGTSPPITRYFLEQHLAFYSLGEGGVPWKYSKMWTEKYKRKGRGRGSSVSSLLSIFSSLFAFSAPQRQSLFDYVFSSSLLLHTSSLPPLSFVSFLPSDALESSLERSAILHSKESRFFYKLNLISASLLSSPKLLRNRTLSSELNLLNLNLPDSICIPLFCNEQGHRQLLSIHLGLSYTLDSASRTPFLLTYEEASTSFKRSSESEMIVASGSPKNRKGEEEEKRAILKTALKILDGLTELDKSGQGRIDVPSIRARVIKRLNDAHSNTSGGVTEDGRPLVEDSTAKAEREGIVGWEERVLEVKKSSHYSSCPDWRVQSLIVKTGSDMRQEQLVTQILQAVKEVWEDEGVDLWVRTYRVMVTGHLTGALETIKGAYSIHQIKKALLGGGSAERRGGGLLDHFERKWKGREDAKENFFKSLVGYSLVSFILQVKDRHNGNILIDSEGHILHIDFGFVLGSHPGFYSVESAPFKFSKEYAEVLGPMRMGRFKSLFCRGFLSLRKHLERIVTPIDCLTRIPTIPSLAENGGVNIAQGVRERFRPGLTETEFIAYSDDLVERGMKSVLTDLYDSLQYYTQGYER